MSERNVLRYDTCFFICDMMCYGTACDGELNSTRCGDVKWDWLISGEGNGMELGGMLGWFGRPSVP